MLKNESEQLLLYQIEFDPDIFCSISPACGEIEPKSLQKFNFTFENTCVNGNDLTFSAKYVYVPSDIDSESKTSIRINNQNWQMSATATISFSSHAENVINDISNIYINRPSFSRAIAETEKKKANDNIKYEMIKRKLNEKKVQKDQLQKRYQSLSRQVNEMNEKIKKTKTTPNKEKKLFYIAIIIFILSIIIHFFHR